MLGDGLHVSRKVRKNSHKYELSINQAFDQVIDGIRKEHGDNCWLHSPLVDSLRELQRSNISISKFPPVQVYSIELWSIETGQLVAGEIGYRVGSIYTSMTGFYVEDGSGSIQLAALGGWLIREKFLAWDFGMMMDYKERLGCRGIDRCEFVDFLRLHRQDSTVGSPMATGPGSQRINARELIV